MAGSGMLARLRQTFGSSQPPFILLSAFDGPQLRQQATAGQVEAVWVKAITPSALHDTLARVSRGNSKPAFDRSSPDGAPGAELRRLNTGRRILLEEDNPIHQQWRASS